mmetsp:Transcript_32587/g.48311  ORF Transcript_32587/g.48311 Transcript_32587/m.48311 type:complete len:199 (-) Transcript_32587:252-848(-)|eukprot:CAMPEP_0194039638 /NCGR_PEP_ID=MMETSP0009_2-20130614/11750_1 /TAXON_ID=210454 /ORGANISM="Grammatophora oceanica, Strain CCMP 410" /LENGTH=198 /DNA_ID=CAMNT_0038682545 /DNA_START=118 /DNA_END=714 /DNA_ORIENTATION=-
MYKLLLVLVAALAFLNNVDAFRVPSASSPFMTKNSNVGALKMSSETPPPTSEPAEPLATVADPMEEEEMDAGTKLQLEKMKRAEELRSQEVFMKKATGKHICTVCEWEYDETKGDADMIGGRFGPGTAFAELPSNWRCPVCRASKDSFREDVVVIPGFEVNQQYGLGTNSMTSGQKNLLIFGGLGAFFVLFLSGYLMN